ncbi:hypothetical protein DL238_10270 [Alteriqipengyuania lutimaris]|uniref:Uncharacterized protein n=2 Tax=Alteriqipengyuania lutimaris TaxID=1538146 RepID=A0A395LLN2_9SPHN|nr:hypothetical protein DL238_10270 [Alteriqipengyuania lutimaris]
MRGVADVTRTLASKSSLNPTLILAAIVVPISLLLSFLSDGQTQLIFFSPAAIVILLAVFQIVWFSIFDRDRLDDHKHTENKMIIAQMRPHFGDSEDTNFIQGDGELIENPMLERGDGK